MFDHLFTLTDRRCVCGMSFMEQLNKLLLCPSCGAYEIIRAKPVLVITVVHEPPKEVKYNFQLPVKPSKTEIIPMPKKRPAKRIAEKPKPKETDLYLDEKTGKFSLTPPINNA